MIMILYKMLAEPMNFRVLAVSYPPEQYRKLDPVACPVPQVNIEMESGPSV